MAEITRELSEIARRLPRATPVGAVVLCFLLPFFSLSSCDAGTETEASGFQIVAGSRLVAQQVSQPAYVSLDDGSGSSRLGPIGPDADAQAVADAARPWVTLTLVLVAVGGCLVVLTDRRWRGIRAIATGLALSTWVEASSAARTAVPKQSQADFSLKIGVVLPLLILIVTCVWAVWALARAHSEKAAGAGSLAPEVRADRQ